MFELFAAAARAQVVRADLDLLDDGLTLDGLVAARALAGDLRDALALDPAAQMSIAHVSKST